MQYNIRRLMIYQMTHPIFLKLPTHPPGLVYEIQKMEDSWVTPREIPKIIIFLKSCLYRIVIVSVRLRSF